MSTETRESLGLCLSRCHATESPANPAPRTA
uniref:Uncharacterized protein n=1 Tax=Arundo donax TaxID=35708 RepID=A0A0A9EIH9_ARUDO